MDSFEGNQFHVVFTERGGRTRRIAVENLGSATGSETGYKHTVKGYESPPAKKRAKKVDENEITVVGYETPKEFVGIVKVEPKKKGQGKKRGATAGAEIGRAHV